MTVSYLEGKKGYTTGATLTLTPTVEIQAGDLLVFACISRNCYIRNPPNEGAWTEVEGIDVYTSGITNPWVNGTNEQFGVWYKIAVSSEPSSYSITSYGAGYPDYTEGILLIFRSDEGSVSGATAAVSQGNAAPGVVLSEDENLSVGFFGSCYDSGSYTGPPTDWTVSEGYTVDPAGDVVLYSSYRSYESATTTESATVQQSGINQYCFACQIGFSFDAYSVATCTISEESGEKDFSTFVEITSEAGATIYYTTDGTDPTTASDVYSDPILVFPGTLKAYAVNSGYLDSDIASSTYTVLDNINFIGGARGGAFHDTLTLTAPSGIQAGDLIIFGCVSRNCNIKNSGGPNEGAWTEVEGVDVYTSSITNPWVNGTDEQFGVWYKIAGSGEPSSYSITPSGGAGITDNLNGTVLVFRGTDFTFVDTSISGNTDTAPGIELTDDENIVIGLFGSCYESGSIDGPPEFWTEAVDGVFYGSTILYSAYKAFPAMTTDSATFQQTDMGEYLFAAQIGFSFTPSQDGEDISSHPVIFIIT